MRTAVPIISTRRRTALRGRLERVLLPGRLAGRAHAAAGLPAWLAMLLGLICFALSIELIAYVLAVAQDFLGVIYDHWQPATAQIPRNASWVFLEVAMLQARPHILERLTASYDTAMLGLVAVVAVAAMLESVNLVVLAPQAAGPGQGLGEVSHRTRRVMLSLGGLWMMISCALWVLLFLALGSLGLHFGETLRLRLPYPALVTVVQLGFGSVLLLILLVWVMRLTRAASCLARWPRTPLPQRCSRCGYLLRGLPPGADCPDCGLPAPASADQLRRPSDWLRRRQVGHWRAFATVSAEVTRRPARFFATLQVLGEHPLALRYVQWNAWLVIAAWWLALPGISAAMIAPDDIYVTADVICAACMTLLVALGSAVAGVLLVGLLTSLLGFAVGFARQEPAWPIAAAAGCYLAGWLPRIAAAEALWVTGLFTVEQLVQRGMFLRASRMAWIHTGIPWEIVLSLIFGLPILVCGLLLLRTALVCYRNVRYACR